MKQFLKVSICSLLFLSNFGHAQVSGFLKINHFLGASPFALDFAVQNNLGNEFKVTRLQYYITKISVVHDGNQITEMHDSVVALVNAADGPYTLINLGILTATTVEAVKFHVGVYAPLNNADPALQPGYSPLAPQSPSMHWGWASGYRFVAFEGKGGASFTQTFQIHGLGNDNYIKTSVPAVSTNLSNDSLYINVNADYVEAVKNINVSNGLMAHSDVGEAKICIQNFHKYVFGPAYVSLNKLTLEPLFEVYPNPTSNARVTINVLNQSTPFELKIFNVIGEVIAVYTRTNAQQFEITLPESGIYFVQLTLDGQQPITKKVISL